MLPLITHFSYLAISIALTIWVAQTLSSNGLAFLRDSFAGNEELSRSVSHLLVVGFYLLNLGFVLLTLRRGGNPADITHTVEILATRIGWVLLVLGAMHLGNMYIFSRWRDYAVQEKRREQTESVRRRAIRSETGL